ncbi:hypothetical protein K7432_018647 [Basidiobolus ranarum]|uniref:Uncharacterized protein n=1 Tax=Basidiobolus ranarum TaxID=34480 RepID=A0ABR2WL14_9FUNG
MYPQIIFISTILFASFTNASDTKLSTPAEDAPLSTAFTLPANENMMLDTGFGFFIPEFMLNEVATLTPEESHLRRINLRKIFVRLSKASPVKHAIRTLPETSGQDTNTPIISDSVTVPDSDKVEDTDVDYNTDDEGNTNLGTSPEETELRRGGRGGRRGRGGRGRGGRGGRGHGRFGRGRFGRSGRFGRFGGRRFGRFGRFGIFSGWGFDWNDDCSGDDCGDC